MNENAISSTVRCGEPSDTLTSFVGLNFPRDCPRCCYTLFHLTEPVGRTMHDPELLLASLKSMLKERQLSYATLAIELGTSLLTVKRSLNKSAVPLDRLLEICRIAQIDFAELAQRAAAHKPVHTYFNTAQDELFSRCPPMYSYFVALRTGLSPAEIARKYRLTRESTASYLDALSSVNLLLVTTSGKKQEVQILIEPPIGHRPGSRMLSRLSATFLKSVVERVVVSTDRHEGDFSLLKPLRLSERQYRQMTSDLLEVVNRYALISENPSLAPEEDDRPEWQLALAAAKANPKDTDPESTIRNLQTLDSQ